MPYRIIPYVRAVELNEDNDEETFDTLGEAQTEVDNLHAMNVDNSCIYVIEKE